MFTKKSLWARVIFKKVKFSVPMITLESPKFEDIDLKWPQIPITNIWVFDGRKSTFLTIKHTSKAQIYGHTGNGLEVSPIVPFYRAIMRQPHQKSITKIGTTYMHIFPGRKRTIIF